MNKRDAFRLIKALRSGKYKQSQGHLGSIQKGSRIEGNCCLGVLCRLRGLKRTMGGKMSRKTLVCYHGETSYPPKKLAGLKNRRGMLGASDLWRDGVKMTLDGLNDADFSFDEIADILYGFIVSDLIEEV